MTNITLAEIETKHSELGQLIERFKQQGQPKTLTVSAVEIDLQAGERYLGPVLRADGSVDCHLVWVGFNDAGLDHKAALKWAKKQGGKLANKREIRLAQANAADLLPTSGWCWLEEEHGESCAWCCSFGLGIVNNFDRSAEGGAVAVRRVSA